TGKKLVKKEEWRVTSGEWRVNRIFLATRHSSLATFHQRAFMDANLSNRVVLVTGASGGIGSEVVRALVKEGARVVAHFSEHGERAEKLAHELGASCVPLGADLTLEAEVERLFAEIEAGLGPVDVLVANAGHWPEEDVPLHEMTLKQWNDTL